MDLKSYLMLMVECGASDLYLSAGAKPNIRIEGKNTPAADAILTPEQVRDLAYSAMDESQRQIFEQELELNLGLALEGVGRFRTNIYHQRGQVGMVVRFIKADVPSIQDLGLPEVLQDLIMKRQGLILVVGATGSGKSTTLAAMLDHRNTNATGHIVTVEDPIEYVYEYKQSVMTQRELGVDTLSYERALASALREAPDVIMIGEIREADTMRYAMHFAETGHLCLATLHAGNCTQAVERIVNFFPKSGQPQLLQDLSLELRAIIAQRLVPGRDGRRVAVVEYMLNTPGIADLIRRGDISELRQFMDKPSATGARSFDRALVELCKQGKISAENAVSYADSEHDVRLAIDYADSHGEPFDGYL
ncbi:MAG: PilT/PilU family type 4a pilus ATPase [Candidatus Competibacterales bacterium]|nr:PilT/PilU family type 4a pilus ATPase [Candidatus Competibacterales bacterium]